MSKLYRVAVEFEMVVQTESEDDAYFVAQRYMKDAIEDSGALIIVGSIIENPNDLPEFWDDMCLPYGGNGVQRIKEILEQSK
ncbi:hypothetical protein ACIPEN_14450 [Herbaspirillum chlorophenolicum]|uniref:Phage protein n=1 Tax=Herbaspirillum chlorophenolicum TaxID=211589 RepID=A0ABW8F182_9BURK